MEYIVKQVFTEEQSHAAGPILQVPVIVPSLKGVPRLAAVTSSLRDFRVSFC